MRYRAIAALFLAASTAFAAAPKPKTIAPEVIGHANAMFLESLSNGGQRRVAIKAAATGTRYFIEESAGVTVYLYDGLNYRRDTFLKGSTLDKAMKKYRGKR